MGELVDWRTHIDRGRIRHIGRLAHGRVHADDRIGVEIGIAREGVGLFE